MRVAAAQIACHPGDIPANLDLHLTMIDAARRDRVDLLLFPELSLTDYQGSPDTAALSRAADCAELDRLAAAAGPMRVSVGFIERAADGTIHNAQALLGGGSRAIHRKLNLPHYGRLAEARYFRPGDRLDPVTLGSGWQAATLICADSWNPVLPWLAAVGGATLLLQPIASALSAVEGFDNPAGWDINLRHTALTYGLPVIMANHCGTRGALDFWGGSRILDADGHCLAQAGSMSELIVAELSAATGEAARRRLPTVRDADPALAARLLHHLIPG